MHTLILFLVAFASSFIGYAVTDLIFTKTVNLAEAAKVAVAVAVAFVIVSVLHLPS